MAIKKLINTNNTCGSIFTGTITTSANPYLGGGTITTGTSTGISNITITPSGTLLTNSNSIGWGDGTFMNSDIIEYIDIFYKFMGIDMDYERFSKMTKEEKKGFIRDLKLQKLID